MSIDKTNTDAVLTFQSNRGAARKAALDEAVEIYNDCKKNNLPFDPQVCEFVLSNAEVVRTLFGSEASPRKPLR